MTTNPKYEQITETNHFFFKENIFDSLATPSTIKCQHQNILCKDALIWIDVDSGLIHSILS